MSEESNNYGPLLAQIRKEAGISQAELGKRTGYKVWSISDYETGRSKLFDEVIMQCAKALHVTPNEILGFTDFEKPAQQFEFLLKQAGELQQKEQRQFLQIMRVVLRGLREKEE